MTKTDVMFVFGALVQSGAMNIGVGQTVEIDDFISLFGEVANTKDYQSYIEIDESTLGYKNFFDECLEKGILN